MRVDQVVHACGPGCPCEWTRLSMQLDQVVHASGLACPSSGLGVVQASGPVHYVCLLILVCMVIKQVGKVYQHRMEILCNHYIEHLNVN